MKQGMKLPSRRRRRSVSLVNFRNLSGDSIAHCHWTETAIRYQSTGHRRRGSIRIPIQIWHRSHGDAIRTGPGSQHGRKLTAGEIKSLSGSWIIPKLIGRPEKLSFNVGSGTISKVRFLWFAGKAKIWNAKSQSAGLTSHAKGSGQPTGWATLKWIIRPRLGLCFYSTK